MGNRSHSAFHRMVKKGLVEKMTFEQRLDRGKRII